MATKKKTTANVEKPVNNPVEKTEATQPSLYAKLRTAAQPVFDAHPNEDEIWASVDGQFFLKKDESAYLSHANSTREPGQIINGVLLHRNGQTEEG
jgi:hypothetical protein